MFANEGRIPSTVSYQHILFRIHHNDSFLDSLRRMMTFLKAPQRPLEDN